MGSPPEYDAKADLIDAVARAIGVAHEELWPIRRSNQPRLPAEMMYSRAAAAALTVAREAVERMETPEGVGDDEGWGEYRHAVLEALGGAEPQSREP